MGNKQSGVNKLSKQDQLQTQLQPKLDKAFVRTSKYYNSFIITRKTIHTRNSTSTQNGISPLINRHRFSRDAMLKGGFENKEIALIQTQAQNHENRSIRDKQRTVRPSYCSHVGDNLKKAGLLFLEIFILIIKFILKIFYYVFQLIKHTLLFVLKLFVATVLFVFMLLTFWVPKIYTNPFKNNKQQQRMQNVNEILKQKTLLFINLENVLVLLSRTKPKNTATKPVKIKDPKDVFKSFYMVKRDFCEEFLIEVS